MIRILVDNNKSRLVGETQKIHELREVLKIRAKNYFWSAAYRRRQWDGYIKYITDTGAFATGNLSWVVEEIKKLKWKFQLEDKREHFKDLHEVTKVGRLKLRGYQAESFNSAINNRFEGLKFIRGILHEATNAGKNLIAAAICSAFSEKRRALFLINNTVIYRQAIQELNDLLPGQVGSIQGKNIQWKRITVCMVQSLGNLIAKSTAARAELAKQDIILVDEADETAARKDCKKILAYCFNAPIRIALTGTAGMSKDKNRNQELISFFGPVIHKTTNKELVDQGYSAKPHIKIIQGNTRIVMKGDYLFEYEKGIVKSKERNNKVWKIVERAGNRGRLPVLILIKLHKHAKYLAKTIPMHLSNQIRWEVVHHKTGAREQIFEDFKKGKIDVLISSMIIRRGKNLPQITTLINAAGGDSEANVLQIFGRGLRIGKGKKHLYLYDFWDKGIYLRRHSGHRVRYYKSQGFEVKELYTK